MIWRHKLVLAYDAALRAPFLLILFWTQTFLRTGIFCDNHFVVNLFVYFVSFLAAQDSRERQRTESITISPVIGSLSSLSYLCSRPIFFKTFPDRVFVEFLQFEVLEGMFCEARLAASVAYPFPQCSTPIQYPIFPSSSVSSGIHKGYPYGPN